MCMSRKEYYLTFKKNCHNNVDEARGHYVKCGKLDTQTQTQSSSVYFSEIYSVKFIEVVSIMVLKMGGTYANGDTLARVSDRRNNF